MPWFIWVYECLDLPEIYFLIVFILFESVYVIEAYKVRYWVLFPLFVVMQTLATSTKEGVDAVRETVDGTQRDINDLQETLGETQRDVQDIKDMLETCTCLSSMYI